MRGYVTCGTPTCTSVDISSAIFTVIFSGIALVSDGYNAIVIGQLNLLFTKRKSTQPPLC